VERIINENFWFLPLPTKLLISHREINSFSLFPFHRLPATRERATIKANAKPPGMNFANILLSCGGKMSLPSSSPRHHTSAQFNGTLTAAVEQKARILITFSIIYKSPNRTLSILALFLVLSCRFIAFIKNSFFMFFMLFIKQLLLLPPPC
jgi:hypothetical protein